MRILVDTLAVIGAFNLAIVCAIAVNELDLWRRQSSRAVCSTAAQTATESTASHTQTSHAQHSEPGPREKPLKIVH